MRLLFPEILLSVAGGALLLGEDAFGRRRLWAALAATALAAAALLVWTSGYGTAGGGMFVMDATARFLKLLTLLAVFLIVGLTTDFQGFGADAERLPWGAFHALLLFSTAGLLFLISSADLLMVLISIEIVSITSFILTGFVKTDRRASEAAIKYFLVGAFSTGLMIYGISLVYGLFGSTSLDVIARADASALPRLPLVAAFIFLLAGFGFKLALVPFHMWAPDAYEGAPTPVTAFLSLGPKTAAFGMLLRVFARHGEFHLTALLAAVAALTMTVGNLAALRQTNVKRLFAYSSVAQMGYVLMGFVATGQAGLRAVLIYLTAYLFMNLGAFACIIAVGNDSRTEDIEGFSGLSQRSLPLAMAAAFFLLSLTGVPPFLGFIGKFSLFSAVLQTPGLTWLAVVGAANSAVSFAYYFSIVHRMFFKATSRPEPFLLSTAMAGCVTFTLLVTVFVGLFPNALLTVVNRIIP